MTDWKALNDRRLRQSARDKIVGTGRSDETRALLENADLVGEAAQYLRQMREHAGLSQGALGEKLGVTQERICELERGNSPKGMSYALLCRAAKACGFENWPLAPLEGPQIGSAVKGAQALPPLTVEFVTKDFSKVMEKELGRTRLGFRLKKRASVGEIVKGEVTSEGKVVYRMPSAQYTVLVMPNEAGSGKSHDTKLIRDVLNNSPAINVVRAK